MSTLKQTYQLTSCTLPWWYCVDTVDIREGAYTLLATHDIREAHKRIKIETAKGRKVYLRRTR